MAERDAGEGGFLGRWSRLKRRAREEPPADAAPASVAGPEPAVPEPVVPEEELPPLDTLGPDSDYTVFLRKGVPAALRAAALRQAWASDPAIAGHRPLVDYDWDCNAPGYGRLLPTDDPGKMVADLFRHLTKPRPGEETAGQPAEPAPGTAAADGPDDSVVVPRMPPRHEAFAIPGQKVADPVPEAAAATPEPAAEPLPERNDPPPPRPRRRHGGAMPA